MDARRAKKLMDKKNRADRKEERRKVYEAIHDAAITGESSVTVDVADNYTFRSLIRQKYTITDMVTNDGVIMQWNIRWAPFVSAFPQKKLE